MIKEILDFWIDGMPDAYSIQMDSKTFSEFMIEYREWAKKYGTPFAEKKPDLQQYRNIDIEVVAKKYGTPFAEKKPDLQQYRNIDIEVVETYARYLRVH
jgi:hypothetical protein